MSATIRTNDNGYTLINPWRNATICFASIWQALEYCRNNGLNYSLEVPEC